jgi:hypothetical protein
MNVLAAASIIIEIIKLAEKLMPEKNKGTEKLAFVRQMLEQVYGDVSEAWPQIEMLASLFVKLANLAGTFRK